MERKFLKSNLFCNKKVNIKSGFNLIGCWLEISDFSILVSKKKTASKMNTFWTVLVLMAITTLVKAWGIYHTGHPGTDTKCERLSVSFCRGLGYNLTSMPNFMGHENQLLAERGVSWSLLINSQNSTCFERKALFRFPSTSSRFVPSNLDIHFTDARFLS